MMVNSTTTTGAGYHNANSATNTKDYCHGHTKALSDLATATESNHVDVCGLVSSNSNLTTQFAIVVASLKEAQHELTCLRVRKPMKPTNDLL